MDTMPLCISPPRSMDPRVRDRPPVQVLITIDTEVWPHHRHWRKEALARDLARDIDGETPSGAFGLDFQLQMFQAHDLLAIFLVEGLFADAVGLDALKRIVHTIQGQGQDVQMHTHAEWLEWLPDSPLPGRLGKNLKDFDVDEQEVMLRRTLANLRAAGANDIIAFRAGNFGGNLDTVRAVARLGLPYDLSLNVCTPENCGLAWMGQVLRPLPLEGVWEFPQSFFQDGIGRQRHVQLAACSGHEMESALEHAWRTGWSHFVILSHSFELLNRRGPATPTPNSIVIRRMERLCRYLRQNNDRFQTVHSRDLTLPIKPNLQPRPSRCSLLAAAWRYAEQLVMRMS
jgi:hypothetical protein